MYIFFLIHKTLTELIYPTLVIQKSFYVLYILYILNHPTSTHSRILNSCFLCWNPWRSPLFCLLYFVWVVSGWRLMFLYKQCGAIYATFNLIILSLFIFTSFYFFFSFSLSPKSKGKAMRACWGLGLTEKPGKHPHVSLALHNFNMVDFHISKCLFVDTSSFSQMIDDRW